MNEFDGRKSNIGRPPIHGRYSKRLKWKRLEEKYQKYLEEIKEQGIDPEEFATMKIKELEVLITRLTDIIQDMAMPNGKPITEAQKEKFEFDLEKMEARSDRLTDSLHRYMTVKPDGSEQQTDEQKEALFTLLKWCNSRN